jgi:hypothetical protein
MKSTEELISDLEAHIDKFQLKNSGISSGSVGWHIAHSLLTINTIIGAMKHSDPAQYKWSFSLPRVLVYTLNKIPRGRAKAPAAVQSSEEFDENLLRKQLLRTKEKLNELNQLKPNHYFDHPFFGKVKLRPAKKFLRLHTKHHLDIISDIVSKS